MQTNQAFLLNVTYYKMNNPMKVFSLSEFHFNEVSAQKVIRRLEFLGYTIENSDVTLEVQNYSKIS